MFSKAVFPRMMKLRDFVEKGKKITYFIRHFFYILSNLLTCPSENLTLTSPPGNSAVQIQPLYGHRPRSRAPLPGRTQQILQTCRLYSPKKLNMFNIKTTALHVGARIGCKCLIFDEDSASKQGY